MDRSSIYVETSVVSYLAARPSRDLITAAAQKLTLDWWERRRDDFELYTSELVLTEASKGDSSAAKRRHDFLEDMLVLPVTASAEKLAKALLDGKAVPQKANADALHVSISAVHCVDYLITWNCTHIDNAETKPIIRRVCQESGYSCPEICTPQELMGDEDGRSDC